MAALQVQKYNFWKFMEDALKALKQYNTKVHVEVIFQTVYILNLILF